jgi:hypothetical protein
MSDLRARRCGPAGIVRPVDACLVRPCRSGRDRVVSVRCEPVTSQWNHRQLGDADLDGGRVLAVVRDHPLELVVVAAIVSTMTLAADTTGLQQCAPGLAEARPCVANIVGPAAASVHPPSGRPVRHCRSRGPRPVHTERVGSHQSESAIGTRPPTEAATGPSQGPRTLTTMAGGALWTLRPSRSQWRTARVLIDAC